ncbi:MAG: argininosuccinate lyase [Candidatus Promineifilaceae bacterium]
MQLWGGRFAKETNALVRAFNDSIGFDQRMWREDIDGSIAWAWGLSAAGVIDSAESETIVGGLHDVAAEWENGSFQLKDGDEDIHTANERRLTEIVGSVGGKLHTGRSRNDQAATDFRLWTRTAIGHLVEQVKLVQGAMIQSAEANHDLPLPGYTHLQHAQPITWGHWIMSHFWPLQRDVKRLQNALDSVDECPLGASALAGTAFPVDRAFLAEQLGFSRVTDNSLDTVSNRDHIVDTLYACAMIGVHLSRLSEQLILFSSQEFSFVRLDDAFSTGSSIMPQKKNPDTLELTRGKSGRLIGYLIGLLVTIKGLPSTYDKDLQEDKEGLFAAYDQLMVILPVMAGVISTLTLNGDKMAAQLEPGLLATDLADYLVKKGMPFRQAHGVIGRIVQAGEERNIPITDLSLEDLQSISDLFSEDVIEAFSVEGSLNARNVTGGTAPAAVLRQIETAKERL